MRILVESSTPTRPARKKIIYQLSDGDLHRQIALSSDDSLIHEPMNHSPIVSQLHALISSILTYEEQLQLASQLQQEAFGKAGSNQSLRLDGGPPKGLPPLSLKKFRVVNRAEEWWHWWSDWWHSSGKPAARKMPTQTPSTIPTDAYIPNVNSLDDYDESDSAPSAQPSSFPTSAPGQQNGFIFLSGNTTIRKFRLATIEINLCFARRGRYGPSSRQLINVYDIGQCDGHHPSQLRVAVRRK